MLLFICCVLTQLSCSKTTKFTPEQRAEMTALLTNLNHGAKLAWRAAVVQKMLEEANWTAARLNLPLKRPIQAIDIRDEYISSPWFSLLHDTNWFPDTVFGTHICDTNIPREQRLQALKVGTSGRINAANFEFGFEQGRLCRITRMDDSETEYYARRLDELVGKPSLIDTNGAYQLATQWLAAVDMDMPALNKLKWTVNQLHYKARGATNYVTLPLYYVDFGNRHYPAHGNLHAYDESLVSVEILGTTKELQDLEFTHELSLSRRPLLLITNILELNRIPNPAPKQLQTPALMKTFELAPWEVSNYSKSFQSQSPKTNSP